MKWTEIPGALDLRWARFSSVIRASRLGSLARVSADSSPHTSLAWARVLLSIFRVMGRISRMGREPWGLALERGTASNEGRKLPANRKKRSMQLPGEKGPMMDWDLWSTPVPRKKKGILVFGRMIFA